MRVRMTRTIDITPKDGGTPVRYAKGTPVTFHPDDAAELIAAGDATRDDEFYAAEELLIAQQREEAKLAAEAAALATAQAETAAPEAPAPAAPIDEAPSSRRGRRGPLEISE
jgi:hypothetical protein